MIHEQKLESGPCDRCGQETDSKVAGAFLCDDCYIARSSCCPEFGPDDLHTLNESDPNNEDS